MSRKVLIVTGDGGDSYEVLYACHRFQESLWEPVVAAPGKAGSQRTRSFSGNGGTK